MQAKIITNQEQGYYQIPNSVAFDWMLQREKQVFSVLNNKTKKGYIFKFSPCLNERKQLTCWFVHVKAEKEICMTSNAGKSYKTDWLFMGTIDSNRSGFKPSKKAYLDTGDIAFKALLSILGMAKNKSLPSTVFIKSFYCLTPDEMAVAGSDLTEEQKNRLIRIEVLAPKQHIKPRKSSTLSFFRR